MYQLSLKVILIDPIYTLNEQICLVFSCDSNLLNILNIRIDKQTNLNLIKKNKKLIKIFN